MPTITISEDTYRKLQILRGSMDWDTFFTRIINPTDRREILKRLKELFEGAERVKRWSRERYSSIQM